MEPKCYTETDRRIERRADREPLFSAAGRPIIRLSQTDAPAFQRFLERCGDYYDLVEGRPPESSAAISELSDGPPERVPHDLVCLGILDPDDAIVGAICSLRNHRRPGQWYVGLMLLDPAVRNHGFGSAVYRSFERWIVVQGADSIVLAVVEANVRAARFWQSLGFGWPRCYAERTMGLRRHVLIEFEKSLK